MALAVLVCFLVSYGSRGLGFCKWLDLALERSGCIRQLSLGTYVEDVAYSPDGRLLAAGGIGHVVKVWDTVDWHLVRTLSEPTDWVEKLAFSPDGKALAVWSQDDKLRIWGVGDGKLLRVLEPEAGQSSSLSDLLYSPDGNTLALTAGQLGIDTDAVWLWNAQDGTFIRKISGSTFQVAFSPDGKLVAHADRDGKLALHRISDGVVVARLPLPTGLVRDLSYSPDGSQLAVVSDRNVYFITSSDGSVVRTLDLSGEYMRESVLSGDWNYFAVQAERYDETRSYDETVSLGLWRLAPDRLVSKWAVGTSTTSSIAFAPDNSTLATGLGYDLVRIWRLPRR
jgi:WD40 repeat protein